MDGTRAVLGEMNWGTKYATGDEDPTAWRDTDNYFTGPVADVQHRFLGSLPLVSSDRGGLAATGTSGFAASEQGAQRARRASSRTVPSAFPSLEPTGDERIRCIGHKPYH